MPSPRRAGSRLPRDGTGESVEIVFTDTGAGIPEENIHKIFDPFFTTKDATKGNGARAAVSYGIIKKHGGDIEVASTVGKGTTVTVQYGERSEPEFGVGTEAERDHG